MEMCIGAGPDEPCQEGTHGKRGRFPRRLNDMAELRQVVPQASGAVRLTGSQIAGALRQP
jgi:methylmalonyl-CoA mutase N-terminal domain/subunit